MEKQEKILERKSLKVVRFHKRKPGSHFQCPAFLLLFSFILIFGTSMVCFASEPSEDSCPPSGCAERSPPDLSQIDVAEITYDEFRALKSSTEPYILLDTRPVTSFTTGHIEGAFSFPLADISTQKVRKLLPQGIKIVVYCQSASCSASRHAAQKLKSLDYDVVDYHGGVQEWTQKGQTLVK